MYFASSLARLVGWSNRTALLTVLPPGSTTTTTTTTSLPPPPPPSPPLPLTMWRWSTCLIITAPASPEKIAKPLLLRVVLVVVVNAPPLLLLARWPYLILCRRLWVLFVVLGPTRSTWVLVPVLHLTIGSRQLILTYQFLSTVVLASPLMGSSMGRRNSPLLPVMQLPSALGWPRCWHVSNSTLLSLELLMRTRPSLLLIADPTESHPSPGSGGTETPPAHTSSVLSLFLSRWISFMSTPSSRYCMTSGSILATWSEIF